MWQAGSKNIVSNNARKQGGRSKNRVPLQMRRVRGELRLVASPEPAAVVQVRVVLNDLSLRGVGIFSQSNLAPGQEIELSFEEPLGIQLKGKVVWCHEHRLGTHVLSPTPFAYRAGVQFSFATPEDEAKLKELCETLARETAQKA